MEPVLSFRRPVFPKQNRGFSAARAWEVTCQIMLARSTPFSHTTTAGCLQLSVGVFAHVGGRIASSHAKIAAWSLSSFRNTQVSAKGVGGTRVPLKIFNGSSRAAKPPKEPVKNALPSAEGPTQAGRRGGGTSISVDSSPRTGFYRHRHRTVLNHSSRTPMATISPGVPPLPGPT